MKILNIKDMKTNKLLIIAALFIGFAISSCTKDPGPGGAATIMGTVTNTDGAVDGAVVYITYGTLEKADAYDNTTTTSSDGTYSIGGLAKGDYYVEASYVSEQGYTFISTGYSVTIGGKKSEVTVDIELE